MEPMKAIARKLEPKETYLKEAVEAALAHHLFTALLLIKELLKEIMKCLPPDRRADILETCTGTKRKTALLTDAPTATNMLEFGMTAEDTTADKILQAITIDDLIRYVDPKKICGVIIRTEWFKKPEHRPFMAVLITGVILHKLLDDAKQKPPIDTPEAIVELIGYDQFMGDRMPPDLRTEYFKQCVLLARGAIPGGTRTPRHFPASDMLKQIFKPEVLVQHLEPSVVYRVFEAVTLKYGWIEKSEPAAPASGSDPAALPSIPRPGETGAAASASGSNGQSPHAEDGNESGVISVVVDDEEDAAAALRGLDVPPQPDAPPPGDVDLGLDLDFLADPSGDPSGTRTPRAVIAVPPAAKGPVPPPPPPKKKLDDDPAASKK